MNWIDFSMININLAFFLTLGNVNIEDLNAMIQQKTIKTGKDYKCTDCDYQSKMKCNLEKHIEYIRLHFER